MGTDEVRKYLTWLAVDRRVSASTQNQAFNAILFLYRAVLQTKGIEVGSVTRAQPTARLPVVLTRDEVRSILNALTGTPRLIACLLYGSGLRLLHAKQPRRQAAHGPGDEEGTKTPRPPSGGGSTLLGGSPRAARRRSSRREYEHAAGWSPVPSP